MRTTFKFQLGSPTLARGVYVLLCFGTLNLFGQPNPDPLGDSPGPRQNDDDADERPTLAIESPDRQALELEFPPLSSEEITITQTPQLDRGPRQVAFHRTVPMHMRGNLYPRLTWQSVDGSRYAYLNIRSPEAKTIRLELLLRLPNGASLRFYHVDAGGETHVGEEILQADIERLNEEVFWTTLVGADHLSIEIRIPEEQDSGAFAIELTNLSHGYVSTFRDPSTSALRCNNHIQVPCAINDGDTTQETADSVVQIRFESGGSGFTCTAALISDISQSTPFLLTAAHCISDESAASSITPVWFFQASSCGTTSVDPRVTATLSQGELITASFENDMSLVLLRRHPPSEAVYASWQTTDSVSNGTGVIGIHHPGGFDKKVWKGSVGRRGNVRACDSEDSNCFLIVDGFIIDISSGTTEPGSSGSPVFLSDTNAIVGVHAASEGECVNNTAFSGRFTNFYPLVEDALVHGFVIDDHGNDQTTATPIPLNSTTSGSIEEAGDQDWFSLSPTAFGDLTIYTSGTTNTVGRLLDSSGTVLAEASGVNGGNFELTVSTSPVPLYLEVSAVGSSVGDYLLITEYVDRTDGLLVDDHGNDSDTATMVTIGQSISGFIEIDGDVDYFRVELNAVMELVLYTSGSLDTLGQLQDEEGEVLSEDDNSGTGSNFRIESELEGGIYFLRVSAPVGTTGVYVLRVESPMAGEPTGDGTGDHGDTRDQATVVEVGSETKGTIDPADDVDFFRVDLNEPGLLTVYTSGSTDTFGRLSSADGSIKLRDDDDGRNFNFHISEDVHADSYFIEVTAYQDKTGDYVLHVEFEPWVLDLNSISLSVSTSEVEEHDQHQVTIFVDADEPVRKDEIIELQLSGTAVNAVDYTIDSNEVSIPIGASQGTSTLTPYRDWINEGNETVEIKVVNPATEPNTELSHVTLTIQDVFDGEGPVYQTRSGLDLTPLVDLRGGQDMLTLITTIFNVGSEESKSSSSVLSVHKSPEFDDSVASMRWEINVPELDSHGGSYRHEFDIDLTELQPDTTYYSRVQVTANSDDTELITDNNSYQFGFALDENNHLKVSCETPTRTSTSGNPDPLLPHQWHIENTGLFTLTDNQITEGIDLYISQSLEAGHDGEGVTIAVVDTGIEICHPDLHTNVDLEKSVNFRAEDGSANLWHNSSASDPFNPQTTGDHGTAVAGIIAAIESNGVGGQGVASKARIRGFNYLQSQSLVNLVRSVSDETSNNTADIAVLGFSSFLPTPFDEDLYSVFGRGTKHGRDSRGTLFIKAAGNSFSECTTLRHVIHPEIGCRNANSDAINNIPHVLVVGAFDALGQHATYSNSGSNLWISAPSGTREPVDVGLVTTDQFGQNRGYGTVTEDPVWLMDAVNSDRDYMSTFIGTSGSVAQVGGAIALLLEVQPALTFRDIKHILATTARTIDQAIRPVQVVIGTSPYVPQQPWTTNAAGYSYHNSFGFGAIDVDAAVDAAKNWQLDTLGAFAVSKWVEDDASLAIDKVPIPDHNGAGVIDILSVEQPLAYENCDENPSVHHCSTVDSSPDESLYFVQERADNTSEIRLEAVSIRLKISHPRMSDLGIHLISPSGTESVLNTVLNNAWDRSSDGDEYFHFLSNAFYGEDPFGEWKLKIVDVMQDEVGEILAWNLRFYVGQRPQ